MDSHHPLPRGNVIHIRSVLRSPRAPSKWRGALSVLKRVYALMLRTKPYATFALWWGVRTLYSCTRITLLALWVLVEPFLRWALLGVAYLSFAMSVAFGFVLQMPHFSKWGMLLIALIAVMLYWGILALMSALMRD